MSLTPGARALVRLAVLLLLAAAAAGVWEILASQAPSSDYHVGVLPGPVAQLRTTSTLFALVLLAGAWLMPWIGRGRDPWVLIAAVHVGAIITIGAMTYGATTGMYGMQIDDVRPQSEMLFWVRSTGQLLLVGCLLDFARRVMLRGPRAARPGASGDAASDRADGDGQGRNEAVVHVEPGDEQAVAQEHGGQGE